jgi:hypothetical protein
MGLSFLPVKQSGRSDDMFRNATLAVVMGLAVSGMAAAQQVLTPEQAIPNQYIVVFDDVQVARTQVAEQRHAEQGHRGRHRLRIASSTRGSAADRQPIFHRPPPSPTAVPG